MNENARIDDNSRNTITALANDGSGNIINVRINPATGALVVEADVTSSNTMIGSTIPGGTPGSVLFIGAGSTLAEDNANLFWDDLNNFLGIGTDTPAATLHVDGTIRFDLGGDATGDTYYRSSGGDTVALPIGSSGDVLTVAFGLPSWQSAASFSGYNQIQVDAVTITPQRQRLNFTDFFSGADNVGNVSTDITLDVAALAGDTTFVTDLVNNTTFTTLLGNDTNFIDTLVANTYFLTSLTSSTTFIDDLIANNYFTTNLANNTNFINTLTSNTTFQNSITTIINNAGPSLQIDLATQVTGVLPLANGGTGQALTDPGYDAAYVWDDTQNKTRLAQLSGLSYDTATNTLTATGSSGAIDIQVFSTNGTWTKPGGAVSVEVICIGAGGGGGSGETRVLNNVKVGGYGGGGGEVTRAVMTASNVTSTVAVTVGIGGTGGAGVATNTTVGNNGTNGSGSSFGSYISAGGGGGGNRGQSGTHNPGGGAGRVGAAASGSNAIAGQGTTTVSSTIAVVNGPSAEYGGGCGGAAGLNGNDGGAGGSSIYGGGGGGAGGSDSGSSNSQPGAGGTNNNYSAGGGGTAGTSGASPVAGGNGTSQINYAGAGGGGGGSSRVANAAAGGNGGIGGGGGGGGCAVNGFTSGAGGNGGNGYVVVITYL